MRMGEGSWVSEYSGSLANGMKSGYGNELHANGDHYEGWYDRGQCSGVGTLKYAKGGIFEGEFRGGRPWDGRATGLPFENNDIYTGEWVGGMCHGRGALKYHDGRGTFEGLFQNGKATKGVMVAAGQRSCATPVMGIGNRPMPIKTHG